MNNGKFRFELLKDFRSMNVALARLVAAALRELGFLPVTKTDPLGNRYESIMP
jgi:hypothetical protein